jgi:hypothetical protein
MTVLITLTTAGANTGPFDLFSDADGYLVPFETLVSKASLVSGYTSTLVPTGATIIRVKSNSVCTNFIDITIDLTTTTTTSSSSSTTTSSSTSEAPCKCFTVENPTEGSLNVTYTPCSQAETTISVGAGLTVSLCVQPNTTIFRDEGLNFPVECTETCSDIITCTTCT